MFPLEVIVKDMKTHKNKGLKKCLILIVKQGTQQDYVIKKQEHKNKKQEHEMCKINMVLNLYYVNICKHEHEKNMTKLKIVFKTCVKYIARNEGSYTYLHAFEDLAQGSFYMCIK